MKKLHIKLTSTLIKSLKGLDEKDKVDFIYNTSALEGNAMTYPEVETLLDGITVGGHKLSDEQQILNQNRRLWNIFVITI